jgi:hypothetical protein
MHKNTLLFLASGSALVALGFGAGVLVQRQYQLAPVRIAEEFMRDIRGAGKGIPPAPAPVEWVYPGANSQSTTGGATLTVGEEVVVPPGTYQLWTTSDGFDEVVRFYADKAKFDETEGLANAGGAGNSFSVGDAPDEPSVNAHLSATRGGDGTGPASSPLRETCLIRRCPSYSITVFISRLASEDETHVILVYDPVVPP